ncbi:MAG: hypothetical protein NC548_44645 [Lachnospiraceae bacterium]|nr:hypothetical protein [Lachnospiraceae bacterium]
MTFDRNKVIDSLCDDLEQWIGWEGFFADSLINLKRIVEKENQDFVGVVRGVPNSDTVFFRIKRLPNEANWFLFYPVNPPNEDVVTKLETCEELIDWFRKKVNIKKREYWLPSIWVKKKDGETRHLITDFDFEKQYCTVNGIAFSMHDLQSNFTLLDGTTIGLEECYD